MGSATSSRGTLRSNTIDIIRVGRQHTFSCACTDLRSAQLKALLSAAPLSPRDPGHRHVRVHRAPDPMYSGGHILSDPSFLATLFRGHFLFLLLQVLSRSYSLYSGEHFLFYVFVISVFSVFTYIHCAHTRSRSALLVYLGERTGSLSGFISLSISDFSIGIVQSHHIYVFCTSSLVLYLEGHIYI